MIEDADLKQQLLHDAGEWTPAKAHVVRGVLERIQAELDEAVSLLETAKSPADRQLLVDRLSNVRAQLRRSVTTNDEVDEDGQHRIVEGVFNGTEMVGADGQTYIVPANYASKSKLVEGDLLKLTIDGRGNFIYKQIGPIDRQRKIATLSYDDDSRQYAAVVGSQRWKLLTAAVTYFKGQPGDEVVIITPAASHSAWAAVENIVRR